MQGETLLWNMLQIGLTVSLAAFVPLTLRPLLRKRYPAHAMCVIWALLAARLLVPVQFTLPDPPVQITPRTNYILHAETGTSAPSNSASAQEDHAALRLVTDEQAVEKGRMDANSVTTVNVTAPLAILWASGGLVFFLWQLGCYGVYRRTLAKHSRAAECPTLTALLEEQRQLLGLRRTVPLYISSAVDCPLLAGLFRPALYLPDENLTDADARFIFRHELTHYRHGDLWLKCLFLLARSVHWFNPLVHLMARVAQEDMELACDTAVVRDMDTAQRRAYGETILRSAEAQTRRRALVSCFTGDKKTLMRRLENLFDTTVKKRGAALVLLIVVMILSIGAAFSIGDGSLSDKERLALAENWAEAEQYQMFAATAEGGRVYLVSERADENGELYRAAQEVHFSGKAVANVDALDSGKAVTTADSLTHFRLLYENELGLPDYAANGSIVPDDPCQAAADLLHLTGGNVELVQSRDVTNDGAPDLTDVRYTFADGDTLTITLAGGLPQDWTYGGGTNARSAAELARQYARAATYKSVWYLYPILSAEKQTALAAHQLGGTGEGDDVWYSKYGGSSPSFRNYVLAQADAPDVYIVVFQEYGGGVTDSRSAIQITVGEEQGRRVITGLAECANSSLEEHESHILLAQMEDAAVLYTQRELFELYYNTGLPWPGVDGALGNSGEGDFNGSSLASLTDPRKAVDALFAYFGEYKERAVSGGSVLDFVPWLEAGAAETDNAAGSSSVELHFRDESESAGEMPLLKLSMRCGANGYWLPIGFASEMEGV